MAFMQACTTTSVHVSAYLPRRVYIYTSLLTFIYNIRRRYGLGSNPVPIDEYQAQAILRPQLREEIREGGCIRILKGLYKGDLGYVLKKQCDQDVVKIALVPRLSLEPPKPRPCPGNAQQKGKGTKRKNVSSKKVLRPPPVPFNPDEARAIYGESSVVLVDVEGCYRFQPEGAKGGQTFEKGLLIYDVYASGAMAAEPRPLRDELVPFVESYIDPKRLNHRLAIKSLGIGDRVAIMQRDLYEVSGILLDIQIEQGVASVEIANGNLPISTVAVKVEDICRDPRPGDHVRAIAGRDKGSYGIVTQVIPSESLVSFVDQEIHTVRWEACSICDS